MAGDALDDGIVDTIDRQLVIGGEQLERRRLSEDEVRVGGIRIGGGGERDRRKTDSGRPCPGFDHDLITPDAASSAPLAR